MLAEFVTWWGQQLLALVPPALAARATGGAEALVLDAAGDAMTLSRRRGAKEVRLGTLRLDDGFAAAFTRLLPNPGRDPVLLRVPRAMALEREVSLPIAAERDVERVIGYDIDRLTPFAADEIFWGVEVAARDRARGKLLARLTIIPRAGLTPVLERLASLSLAPAALEVAEPAAAGEEHAPPPRRIRLSHDGANGRAGLARAALPLAGAALALVLVSPFLRQALILRDLAARKAALAPQMREVNALRSRILGDGGDAFGDEVKRVGDTLAALAAVTEILPDDSYLTEFSLRERKLEMSGLSAAAAKLIAALSEDQRIRNPAFSAPVTRNESIKLDVFSIHAEWAQ